MRTPSFRAALTGALLVTTALIMALGMSACGDSTTPPATYGNVVVDVQPDAAAATWHLAGPDGYSHDGAGDATLTGLSTGSYTITWGVATGYTAPANATLSLTDGATATFTGAYAVTGMIFPDTPDKMMQNFQVMYETMNVAELEPLLSADYAMYLQQDTVDTFPDLGPTLDVAEEQRIHERMFSGHDVTDPDGYLVPGVMSITFQTFVRQGAWVESAPGDVIPGTPRAVYDVVILMNRGPTQTTLKTQGSLVMYAVSQDSMVDGVATAYYRMRGMADLTGNLKIEMTSWGIAKGLFR